MLNTPAQLGVGVVAGALLVCAFAGAGCADRPGLSARMSDDEVRAAAAEAFPRGATLHDVQLRLDELHVSRRYRGYYAPSESHPEVLLVRLFDGGFWLTTDDCFVDFLDLSLVFDSGGYERAVLYRDRVRYYCGDPVNPPTRPAAGPMRQYPGLIPPPIDPLEGAQ